MLFDTVLQLHEIHMEERLILNVLHIDSKIMTEAGIYGLSRRNNMGVIIRGIDPLKFIPIYLGTFKYQRNWKGGSGFGGEWVWKL